jgi:regulator of protease activity HflC (stomatin/prohibitin superfamily)
MKKLIVSVFAVFLAFMAIGCSKVPAGHVGIKVYLLGGDKGVDSEEIGVGRVWVGINEELYLFPTFKQNYVWTKDSREGSPDDESITFQTSEGLTVNADFGITYELDRKKITTIFQKYRKGVDEITDIFLRNKVRDVINSVGSKYEVASVYGSGKTKLIEEVNSILRKDLEPEGILIEKVYLIGEFRLPQQVTEALNSKIEAKQRAEQRENELAESIAEAKKKIATAKAEAEANRFTQNSVTKTVIEYEKVKKWNGVLPVVMGGNSMPMIDVKSFTSNKSEE